MPGIVWLIGLAVFFLTGVFLLFYGFRALGEKQMVESVPSLGIGAVVPGPVEVSGEAAAVDGMVRPGPFTGRDAVYYRSVVEEYRRHGRSMGWVIIYESEYRPEFYVEDSTGSILVDPEGACYDVAVAFEYASGLLNDPPENVKAFLGDNGLLHGGLPDVNRRMRYREYLIEPRRRIYIMGTAVSNPVAADGHGAGFIIHRGEGRRPFYISAESEKKALRRGLKNRAYMCISAGVFICLICIAGILSAALY